jgi:D-erythro-7,8-dihydroneopterin triphosphate epimerase
MIIRIKNLRLRAIVGVNPWERTEPQAVIINLEVEFDGQEAARSDNLEDTIDYRTISKKVIELVENSQYQLIETLAGNVLRTVMEDKRICRARVEVDKPNAVKSADSTSVELEVKSGTQK